MENESFCSFLLPRRSRTHIPSETESKFTKCHALQAKRHANFCDHLGKGKFLQLPVWTRQLWSHHGGAHTFLLKHVECHKVPRLPRKTTRQVFVIPWERELFAAPPIDTATLLPRRSCADSCEHQSGIKRTRPHPQTPM